MATDKVVISGELVWRISGAQSNVPEGGQLINAFNLCKDDEGVGDKYRVMHYSQEAIGLAFGPLSLAATLRFCFNLKKRMQESRSTGPVVLLTSTDEKDQINAAALIGSFLVLCRGYSVQRTTETMGSNIAEMKFVCSWARREGQRILQVEDVWSAMAEASIRDWINLQCLEVKEVLDWTCENMRSLSLAYDACWVIPGRILLCADPTTVATDPNPATLTSIFPPEARIGSHGAVRDGFLSVPATPSLNCQPEDTPPSRPKGGLKKIESVHTVCKEFVLEQETGNIPMGSVGENEQAKPPHSKPISWVSFLQRENVELVIQANFGNEPGMPGGHSYDAANLPSFGIDHLSLPFQDTGGAIPPKQYVVETFKAVSSLDSLSPAVAVHCKGGFGRSAVLACCLAIERFDLPGRAALAWVRLVRPGAITTPEQERFLCSFAGRRDLSKWAGGGHRGDTLGPPPQCCSIQ